MKKVFYSNSLIYLALLVSLTIFTSGCRQNNSSSLIRKNLNSGWEFKKSTAANWLPAMVPGTIHTDLLQNKIIAEPFYRENESKLQWIEKETWIYRATFNLDDDIFKKQNIELDFEGLDTYAEISLNGQKILSCDNMFRSWKVDAKPFLKETGNILEIAFSPSTVQDSTKSSALNYKLPDSRVFSRKAAYQSGWDWGPRFVTCGIWKPVSIEAWNDSRIQNIFISNDHIFKENALMNLETNILSCRNCDASIELLINKKLLKSKEIKLTEGNNQVTFSFEIENPELWWCNGLGEPQLYDAEVRLLGNDGLSDVKNTRFGIRKIELIRDQDSIGRSFYIKLNGQTVFMKGANYIPSESFVPRIADEKYKALIITAKEANMNMLRVWGGGIYENDIFYDLCDENGILVWQDFMFACNMYPGDVEFLENVKHETEDNIIRLRNHPSLALWCGNNEIDEAWHNWGWQKQFGYSHQDSTEIWGNYLRVFDQILPEALQKLDPNRPYHPSSPSIGWGHKESLQSGDSHYWGVWWGEQPFEVFTGKVGRFMSEYGFQGMPAVNSIKKFTLPEDRKIGSEVLQVHQKHSRGTEIINTYMERDYKIPTDFEDYVYVSQLLQAEGIITAIEAQRRAMPRCMGSLYWQLNDCWPVTSWSSVDYYGNWKALHYFVKKAYSKFLISPVIEAGTLHVYVVSDSTENCPASLQMKVLNFNGNILWQKQQEILIKALTSEIGFSIDLTKVLEGKKKDEIVFAAMLYKDGKQCCENLFYFDKPKFLNLPITKPEFEIQKTDEGYLILIKTTQLLKNLYLEVSDYEGKFDDNFFDVLPGQQMKVHFITNENVPDFKNKITFKTLNGF